jgi:hypothetical protein
MRLYERSPKYLRRTDRRFNCAVWDALRVSEENEWVRTFTIITGELLKVRERFSVVVERTVNELRGVACVAWESQPPACLYITASRSFGGPLYNCMSRCIPVPPYRTTPN